MANFRFKYANIDQAVKALINKCIREKIYSNEISTLKDFINEYDILHKKIDALLLPLKL
jgi:polyribonucleotide nucleotidyltransferase